MKGLGQTIADKNLKKGIAQGEELKLIEQICRKMVKGKDISQIAEELEEEEGKVSSFRNEKTYEFMVSLGRTFLIRCTGVTVKDIGTAISFVVKLDGLGI